MYVQTNSMHCACTPVLHLTKTAPDSVLLLKSCAGLCILCITVRNTGSNGCCVLIRAAQLMLWLLVIKIRRTPLLPRQKPASSARRFFRDAHSTSWNRPRGRCTDMWRWDEMGFVRCGGGGGGHTVAKMALHRPQERGVKEENMRKLRRVQYY